MQKKFLVCTKKLLCLLLLSILLLSCVTGCNTTSSDSDREDTLKEEASGEPAISAGIKLDSLTIQINGKELSLPFAWSEIEDIASYYYKGEPPKEIESDEYISFYWSDKDDGGCIVDVTVCNPSKTDATALGDCLVTKIDFDTYNVDEPINLQIPGGITLGSSYDDVVKAYGTPVDENKRSDGSARGAEYSFPDSDNEIYHIEFSFVDNVINSLEIKYKGEVQEDE